VTVKIAGQSQKNGSALQAVFALYVRTCPTPLINRCAVTVSLATGH